MTEEAVQTRLVERQVVCLREEEAHRRDDVLTVEEPLEIRIGDEPIAVVMRTPQDDFDLAAGFLFTEGVARHRGDIDAISYCPGAQPPNQQNVVEVRLAASAAFDRDRLKRNFYASSSCGICGKASIDAVRCQGAPLTGDFQVRPQVLYQLDEHLRAAQAVFARTGSLHAAALFDVEGRLLVLREDVGRHNAVDKVVGSFVRRQQPVPQPAVLMVSGRTSFEIIQKAYIAGICVVAAVSAPSSLAVDLAEQVGMTLIGFLRGRGCNIYTGAQRVA
ncbi:MAG: formate dehydrogenase accessory sulfurtransferase FdhD [Candidatus Latescibacteria bacterium]|nr:formate dehydrogenase accessory sulfurtransferase FdhD [Candidatus Latescibacterota bacterium]